MFTKLYKKYHIRVSNNENDNKDDDDEEEEEEIENIFSNNPYLLSSKKKKKDVSFLQRERKEKKEFGVELELSELQDVNIMTDPGCNTPKIDTCEKNEKINSEEYFRFFKITGATLAMLCNLIVLAMICAALGNSWYWVRGDTPEGSREITWNWSGYTVDDSFGDGNGNKFDWETENKLCVLYIICLLFVSITGIIQFLLVGITGYVIYLTICGIENKSRFPYIACGMGTTAVIFIMTATLVFLAHPRALKSDVNLHFEEAGLYGILTCKMGKEELDVCEEFLGYQRFSLINLEWTWGPGPGWIINLCSIFPSIIGIVFMFIVSLGNKTGC